MTHDNDAIARKVRGLLSRLLVIDQRRLTVDIRSDGDGHSTVIILVDGDEPRGRHRELIALWAQGHGGQIVGDG
jgi:hypothetical protein